MFVEQLFNNFFLTQFEIQYILLVCGWWGGVKRSRKKWKKIRKREITMWFMNRLEIEKFSFIFAPIHSLPTLNIQFNQLHLVSHSFTDCTHNRIQEKIEWDSLLLSIKLLYVMLYKNEIRVEKQRKMDGKVSTDVVWLKWMWMTHLLGFWFSLLGFPKIRINWRKMDFITEIIDGDAASGVKWRGWNLIFWFHLIKFNYSNELLLTNTNRSNELKDD